MSWRRSLDKTGKATADDAKATGVSSQTALHPAPAGRGANDRIRIGLVGCGGMGHVETSWFLKQPDVAVPVICDVKRDRLEFVNKDLFAGRAEAVSDYRLILDRKDIDAVLIASPDHWHALMMIHACQAGKDVFVEKPMMHCVAEGRCMIRAAEKYGRVVQVGTQQLSGWHYIRAAEFVQAGGLGKVTHVHMWNSENWLPGVGHPKADAQPDTIDWDLWLGPAPSVPYHQLRAAHTFRFFWDYAGGIMTDWGTHHVGTVHHVMGEDQPRSVTSVGAILATDSMYETPDTLHALWEYPGGWTMSYAVQLASGYNPQHSTYGIVFHGTKAAMFLDRSGYEVIQEGRRGPAEVVGKPRIENFMPEPISTPHIRNFLDCVKSRAKPTADVVTGHRASLVPQLANIAMKVGRKLQWDAENERFLCDDEASALLTKAYRDPHLLPEV